MSKDFTCKKIGIITVIAFACVAIISISTVRAQTTCVNLSHDLYSGLSDSGSDNSILTLQNYLRYLGYLSATPNGYFGAATLSAAKIYQSTNTISATGYVGPITRAAIEQKTCSVVTPVTTTVITPTTPSPIPVINPVPVVSNITITSPSTGVILPTGSSTVIRWNTSPTGSYNIVLEQPGGIGAGFIAQGLSSGATPDQYLWKVGNIFSSDVSAYQNVPAGTYRIRLEGASSGALSTDQVSGWFTTVDAPFTVTSVVPSSAFADNSTSVVLLGSGFSSSVSIYFGTNFSGVRATNEYASPDGTVLVFTIPTAVSPGPQMLYIDNGVSSSPISVPFVVSSIQ